MRSKNCRLLAEAVVCSIAAVAFVLCASFVIVAQPALAQGVDGSITKKAAEKKAVEKKGTGKKPADGETKKKPRPPVETPEPKNADGGKGEFGEEGDTILGGDDEKGAKSKAAGKKTEAGPLTIDEQYVRDKIVDALHPTKIEWLEDGKVKLLFDFSSNKRAPEHDSIFTQKVGSDQRSKFRWTLRHEYGWTTGTSGTAAGSGDDDASWWYGGLRMGMDGRVFLSCWFTDDVEAELHFTQHVSYDSKQLFAFVYSPDGNKAVGSNFGTQAVAFAGGALSKRKGTVDPVLAEHGMKLKFRLRDGMCEVFRDGRLKEKIQYSKKSFASGRIGFIWGGGIACICPRLEITGRIDAKKMAQDLRKRK